MRLSHLVFFSIISFGSSFIHKRSMNMLSTSNWLSVENIIERLSDKNMTSSIEVPSNQITIFQYPETKLSDAIILINIAVFSILNLSSFSKYKHFFVKSNNAISRGEIYRLFTSMFLHQTLFHISSNMISLKVYGPMVEKWYGTKKFLFVYLASGIFSNLSTFLMNVSPLSIGASGAIYGLIGALNGFYRKNRAVLGNTAEEGLKEIRLDLIANATLGVFFKEY